MSAGERLSRLLALVPWLLAHDGVSIAECAEHFGVSEEQLEVDLWLLVVCGLPGYGPDQLVDIQFWDDGRIHVLDPQTLSRPLRLTAEEMTSLLVTLRMIAQLPGVTDRDAVLSAAAKLEEAAHTGHFVAIDVAVPPAVRDSVDEALRDHRELTIEYAAATRDEVTTRTVRPMRLFSVDGVAYLEAYCLSAEALRTFRLDRVLSAAVGATRPTEELPADLEPGNRGVPAQTAILLLEPSARWIIDVHHAEEAPSRLPDGRTRVTLPMHSPDWAVRLVLSLQGAAVVEEPADLVAAVAATAAAAIAAYPDDLR